MKKLKDSGIEIVSEREGVTIFYFNKKYYTCKTELFDVILFKIIRMGFI